MGEFSIFSLACGSGRYIDFLWRQANPGNHEGIWRGHPQLQGWHVRHFADTGSAGTDACPTGNGEASRGKEVARQRRSFLAILDGAARVAALFVPSSHLPTLTIKDAQTRESQ